MKALRGVDFTTYALSNTTLGKCSNRSHGNFNISAKLSNVQKLLLFQRKYFILEVISRTIVVNHQLTIFLQRKRWVTLFCKITQNHAIHITKNWINNENLTFPGNRIVYKTTKPSFSVTNDVNTYFCYDSVSYN